MESVECTVIGAGVIGLAIARRLAMTGREVLIIETGDHYGTGISSRNSEVIHAGIYYPKDSLKARLCVAGRQQLYAFCESHGVAFKKCGKLIASVSSQQDRQLQALRNRASLNGVDDLIYLDKSASHALEPALDCHSSLLSPQTGIIDSHAFMAALLGDAEKHSAALALNTPVLRGNCAGPGIEIETGGSDPMRLHSRFVINAAGLNATTLAKNLTGLDPQHIPRSWLAKGSYFSLRGKSPFRHLIYPMPEPGGLGVHLTLDMGGRARFGPDVEWIDKIDYEVSTKYLDRFYIAIRKYWPGLPDGNLAPDYSGIRPKIAGPSMPAADFVIQDRSTHGIDGLINLFGIESPGLTASLAIADHVAEIIGSH